VARRQILPKAEHQQSRHLNNHAEKLTSTDTTSERQMQWFKPPGQVQDFLCARAFIHDHVHPRRHLLTANSCYAIWAEAFNIWQQETGAQIVE
jgi:putative transposase